MPMDVDQSEYDRDVSRETLEEFASLVKKWNPAINLVSKTSLQDLWERHFVDSLQLHKLVPEKANHCMDIGSGGGFPGIVLAIASHQSHPVRRFTLVESDQRKATFLRESARQLALNVTVISDRVESLSPQGVDVISARALAPLSKLLGWACVHLDTEGVCIFPKGATYKEELDDAKVLFDFDLDVIPSQTDQQGAILKICRIVHV